MAELFPGNYVNPDYASPEQLAQQRAWAAALMKRSGEPVNRPAGAIGNMIDALTGRLEQNRANEIQSQSAGQNAQNIGGLISELQRGRQPDPGNIGRIMASPTVSPETRALMNHLLGMKQGEDVAGRPNFGSPATGVVGAPIRGAVEPGYRVPETAGSVSTVSPVPAPPFPGQRPMTPTNPQGGMYGGLNFRPVDTPAPAPPGVGGPPQAPVAPVAAPAASRLDALAEKDRQLTAAKTFSQGAAEGVTGIQKADMAASFNAPSVKTIAGVMLDDLKTHGDQMTFGPTAEWSNKVKRVAANYAPGPMRSQLEALASADSFSKMSSELAGLMSSVGTGSDARLLNSIQSIPGAHNSKQGAQALLEMVLQRANQQQELRKYVGGSSGADYERRRDEFFAQNPLINPITGNPIERDLKRTGTGGGAKIIGVEPPR